MDKERIEIEDEILNKLSGKIFLLQDLTLKREIAFQAFLDVYNSPRCQKFIRKSKQGLELETFFNEFFSHGVVDEFLADPEVEDIMIDYLSPIYVHKTKHGLVKTDKRFASREELDLFIKKLIIFSGRTAIKKINNVELTDIRGRANIAYSPFGPQITVTRAKKVPLSIVDLIESGTLTPEVAAQFWLYVEGLRVKPANIIISGGPGSGKTTLLNALFSFIPADERIVVIEDTLELNTELEDTCSRLESDDEVNLADLVKNSLRMRPDRIIVGEVRGREAQDLMTAMNIGKYCMGTLHASTARETIMRLEYEPMNVSRVLINLVDVFVIMLRRIVDGKIKRVVGELSETAGIEEKIVLLSSLWNYDFSNSKFVETMVSSAYRDKLSKITGRPLIDIINELRVRTNLMKILLERNIKSMKEITVFCRKYSSEPELALRELGLKRENLL
jgi:flagellar protein FlaI